MRILSRRDVLVLAAWIGACGPGFAQQAASASGTRIALDGYDPVSYFDPGRPEKGSSKFTFTFDDAVYWFKTADHRGKFAADPERYAPQFAGYCALTLARGEKAQADPEAWAIADGKLYVFGSKLGVPEFKASTADIISKANSNWQNLHQSK